MINVRQIRRVRIAWILLAFLLALSYAAESHAGPEADATPLDTMQVFQSLVSQAVSLFQARRIDEALVFARRAQKMSTQATLSDSRTTANALNQLGMVFSYVGFNREAKASYERGLALAKKILLPTDVLLANLHNNLGQVEERLGNLKAARDHLASALSIKTHSDEAGRYEVAITMDNLGSVVRGLGDLERAKDLHEQALAIFRAEKGQVNSDVATAMGNLGRVYYLKREYTLAGEYQQQAFLIHNTLFGPEHRATLVDIANLVEAYLQSGDERRADDLVNYLVLIGGDTPSGHHMDVAHACYQLAVETFSRAQLALAERLAARALILYRAAAGPTAPETLDATFLLANALAKKGNFAAAEDRYIHLLNVYGPDEKAKSARVRIELGKMFRQRGKESHPGAIAMFESGIEELREISPVDEETLASALGNLGLLYFDADQPKLALQYYSEALALLEHKEISEERPWLLYNQSMLWYHLGEYGKARAGYEKVKAIWASSLSSDHPFVGTVEANLALVYWIQGDTDRALSSFEEANRIAERQAQRTLTVGTEWERLAYARNMQHNLYKVVSFCFSGGECDGESARLAATMLLQRKGRVLDAMAQTMVQIREHLSAEDRVLLYRLDMVRSQIAELIAPLHSSRDIPENRARSAALKEEEDQLQSALSHKSALYRARLNPVTIEMVTDTLPADAVLVEYLRYPVFDPVRTGKGDSWTGENYAALVLRPQRGPQVVDLGSATDIEKKVQTFRSKLQPDNSDPARGVALADAGPEDFRVEARELYQLLVAPMREVLSDMRLLLIAPDGLLNMVPFGLLSDAENKRLTDVLVLNYLYSGRELVGGGSNAASSPTMVVVANPDFDAKVAVDSETKRTRFSGRGEFAALPGTHAEAEAIQALFPSSRRLEGRDAVVDALKRLSRPGILHIATHGVFAPVTEQERDWKTEVISSGGGAQILNRAVPSALENPMLYSGLVLAGANRTDQGGQYSVITALEIANLDLRGTQLVVLSACETGLGTIKQGDEFAGLRRAISIAGAASQVTSLWKVNDKATQVLMTEYYQLLLDGHGRAEALQLAQQRIERDPRWRHPVYWAAFVPSGDWTPMGEFLAKVRRSSD